MTADRERVIGLLRELAAATRPRRPWKPDLRSLAAGRYTFPPRIVC
jgi:hypothetical protein